VSKKKRVRRDLEKLFRTGRYWEFLRLVEEGDLRSAQAGECKEAWKLLVRQALMRQEAFADFCREVGTLKVHPAFPDFQLLMHLRKTLSSEGPASPWPSLKGLSPEAERLRGGFEQYTGFQGREEKLKRVLGKFLATPEKITRRVYEDLAEVSRLPDFARQVSALGELIPAYRQLNQKTAVSRGRLGVDYGHLKHLDRLLQNRSRQLPAATREILLFPFVDQLSIMVRRLAPELKPAEAAGLLRSVPFLLPSLAGERAGELQKKLLFEQSNGIAPADLEMKALQQEVPDWSFEEKLTFLGKIRLLLRKTSASSRDANPSTMFLDEVEPGAEDDDADRFATVVVFLYQNILAEISRRSGEISSRDRKELIKVMEPTILQDLDLLIDAMGGPEPLIRFLDAAMAAKCAGTKLGLFGLLVSGAFRDRDLQKRSSALLDQSPPATTQDMQWLADEWEDLYFPHAQALAPLLTRYEDNLPLLLPLATRLCAILEASLLEATVFDDLVGFPFGPKKAPRHAVSEDVAIFRRHLEALAPHKELDLVRLYLRCHVDGRLTSEAQRCWLKGLFAMNLSGFWDFIQADLTKALTLINEAEDVLFRTTSIRKVADARIEAILLFLFEHFAGMSTEETGFVERLLDPLLAQPNLLSKHHSLLIRLNNLLVEKSPGPQSEAARSLHRKIMKALRHLSTGTRKTLKPRNRRRS
jgi:hypothetical protein